MNEEHIHLPDMWGELLCLKDELVADGTPREIDFFHLCEQMFKSIIELQDKVDALEAKQ